MSTDWLDSVLVFYLYCGLHVNLPVPFHWVTCSSFHRFADRYLANSQRIKKCWFPQTSPGTKSSICLFLLIFLQYQISRTTNILQRMVFFDFFSLSSLHAENIAQGQRCELGCLSTMRIYESLDPFWRVTQRWFQVSTEMEMSNI